MNTAATLSPPSATARLSLPSTLAETDPELMARIQARDGKALATLSLRYRLLLRSIIGRVVHDDADVDEVAQDVVLEVWNRGHTFHQEKGTLEAWLVTLARRRAIDRIRRRVSYTRATERHRHHVESQAPSFQQAADAAVHDSDIAAIFRRILVTMPAMQRQAVELTFYGGLSQREIAKATGYPLGTVKTRIELGLRKIRTALFAINDTGAWLADLRASLRG